jgi:hypothetical protein
MVTAIGLFGPSPHEAAASELRRLAKIASGLQPLSPGPDQYLLIRWEELRREGFTTVGEGSLRFETRLRVSTWVAQDRSGLRREEVLSSEISEEDRQAWIDAGQPTFELPRTYRYRPGAVPIHEVSRLPTDPEALLRVLRSGEVVERPPGDDQVFYVIGEILGQGVAPPELRSALFESAARLRGVTLVGSVEDPLGRGGTAVELAGADSRTRLVFDPDSAQLLSLELYEGSASEEMELRSWIAYHPTVVVEDAPPNLDP